MLHTHGPLPISRNGLLSPTFLKRQMRTGVSQPGDFCSWYVDEFDEESITMSIIMLLCTSAFIYLFHQIYSPPSPAWYKCVHICFFAPVFKRGGGFPAHWKSFLHARVFWFWTYHFHACDLNYFLRMYSTKQPNKGNILLALKVISHAFSFCDIDQISG